MTAATREYRGRRPMTVIRHLNRAGATAPGIDPDSVLHVESAPVAMDDYFNFEGERAHLWSCPHVKRASGSSTVARVYRVCSTIEQFDGKSYNQSLYDQLSSVLPKVDLWLWGHEHDLVIFDEYKGLKRGRCVRGSAFPVGNFEMPVTHVNADVPFQQRGTAKQGRVFLPALLCGHRAQRCEHDCFLL